MAFIKLSPDKSQFRIAALGHKTQTRPYIMRSAFPLLACYKKLGTALKAQHFLDRTMDLGFDGVRLFGETWAIDKSSAFFGNPKYTPHLSIVQNGAPANSSVEILKNYWDLVDALTEDLEQRDMIAEFCVIATIKDQHPGMQTHLLNNVAQGFAEGFDAKQCPYIFETVNEWDAYSSLTADEVRMMGPRWRRNEPGHPMEKNFPGSLIGVSGGGDWSPGFDDSGYTHRNIHPPRGTEWDKGFYIKGKPRGPLGAALTETLAAAGGRPVAFNETVHCWTKEQRQEWEPRAPKWVGLSTTDVKRHAAYSLDVLRAGISLAFHDLYGMSVVMANKQPFTPFEESMRDVIVEMRSTWK